MGSVIGSAALITVVVAIVIFRSKKNEVVYFKH